MSSKKKKTQAEREAEQKRLEEEKTLKGQGNKAFQEQKYELAIDFYTRAIAEQPENHTLYSNRSAAYAALRNFDEALNDANTAISMQPSWFKGHYRQGVAFEGQGKFSDAYACYTKALTLEPNDAVTKKAAADLSIMMEELKQTQHELANMQNPEHDRFNVMLNWLRDGGAKFPSLYLQYYDADYRGVHASTRIPNDTVILDVPLPLIMTSEVAKASDVGKKILAAEAQGLELRSKHSYLASYLLQEKRKGADSYWHPYIICLPKDYRNMPIYFDEHELSMLRGSMTIEKIEDRKESLRAEYDALCRVVEGFSEFSYDDFVWARLVVITRIFGLVINGNKTDGLVPMADMLNHKRPRETKWTFDDARNGFTITSLKALNRGDQVYDSYGRKCNSRFFVNYGFSLEENEDNEAMFKVEIPMDDPHFLMKIRFLGGKPHNAFREFQIPIDYKEKKVKEAFSFLRFAHARDSEIMLLSAAETFKVDEIEPIAVRNEIEVLKTLARVARRELAQFPQTLAEDNELLKNPNLTMNERNCILMRRGEKEVFQFYIDLHDTCVPLLQTPWKDLKRIAAKKYSGDGRFDAYVTSVVAPLVKKA